MTPLTQTLRQAVQRAPIVVGHRGDSGSFPENTLPAFRAAVLAGSGMIEFDIRQTRDGVLVCIHDESLDRTSDSESSLGRTAVRVEDVDLETVQRVDAGSWKSSEFAGTPIPTLESGLRVIQDGSVAMIEHKAGDAQAVVDLLRRMDLVDDVLVQSFDWAWLKQVRVLEPRLTIGALGGWGDDGALTEERLEGIAETGASLVHWGFPSIRKADVEKLHALGYLVCVYTIDEPEDYQAAFEMGIDLMTTNHPARLAKYLAGVSD